VQIAGAVLTRVLEPLGYNDDVEPIWPKERSSIGKPANFGLSYGCGVQSLEGTIRVKRGAGYKEGDAQRSYDTWHRFHPQCSTRKAWFKEANIDEVRSLLSRRIRCTGFKPDGTKAAFKLTPQQGVNWLIQSSGRDMRAIAVGELWPALDRFLGL